jgi:D-alanyl-lipoteichoic acid acyltransferase DltB (MBOAT superfamily)
MSYNSVEFFGFILSVFVVYFIVPKSIKWVVLLIASYVYYYFAAGLSMMSYLLITTISVFLVGYFMGVIDSAVKLKIEKIVDNENRRDRSKSLRKKAKQRKKLVLIVGIFINIGILAFLKYSGFVILNLNDIFSLNITSLDLLLPLGLSFYTFQATGYIIDVYRGKVAPDRNIAKFALFVSFFPQIVQGPISRYSDLAKQLYEPHSFYVTRIKYGAQLIMWGMFKKLVIADRAAFHVQ